VFAYMNLEDEDDAEYLGRVQATLGAEVDVHGLWRDSAGAAVEDLDLPESPLLWAEARRLVLIVTPEPFEELAGLEMCLEALREYAD
jgi:nucleoside 2-deoxyribosyltransferase